MTSRLVALLACLTACMSTTHRTVTVLHIDGEVELTGLRDGSELWVRAGDLPAASGFEVEPQGLCRGDVCIPVTPADTNLVRKGSVNVTELARRLGQAFVADEQAGVWSFDARPSGSGSEATTGVAPDFALPDRRGELVRLSSFRGRKVLLLTWASW